MPRIKIAKVYIVDPDTVSPQTGVCGYLAQGLLYVFILICIVIEVWRNRDIMPFWVTQMFEDVKMGMIGWLARNPEWARTILSKLVT